MAGLLGHRDSHLRLIELAFSDCEIIVRGNEISILGESSGTLSRLFEELVLLLRRGEMVDDTVAATRRISLDLRPLMLDDLGLNAAIEWLAQEYERRSGLQVALRCDQLPDLMSQKVLTALYRIVQEALTNIVRHAKATRVAISMVHADSLIELRIEDNGTGFPDPSLRVPGKSFGLIGIRERVLMLGGDLSLGNLPGGGASMVVRLPMSGQDATGYPLESAASLSQLVAGATPSDTRT